MRHMAYLCCCLVLLGSCVLLPSTPHRRSSQNSSLRQHEVLGAITLKDYLWRTSENAPSSSQVTKGIIHCEPGRSAFWSSLTLSLRPGVLYSTQSR